MQIILKQKKCMAFLLALSQDGRILQKRQIAEPAHDPLAPAQPKFRNAAGGAGQLNRIQRFRCQSQPQGMEDAQRIAV